MAADPVEQVLRLVADGHLTAEQAGPILDALEATRQVEDQSAGPAPDAARALRVLVSDTGRTVINLRVPLALGKAAFERVPGISSATADRIRDAFDAGIRGPILDIDEDGNGVRILLE